MVEISKYHFVSGSAHFSETPVYPHSFFLCLLCDAISVPQMFTSQLAELDEPNISPGLDVV